MHKAPSLIIYIHLNTGCPPSGQLLPKQACPALVRLSAATITDVVASRLVWAVPPCASVWGVSTLHVGYLSSLPLLLAHPPLPLLLDHLLLLLHPFHVSLPLLLDHQPLAHSHPLLKAEVMNSMTFFSDWRVFVLVHLLHLYLKSLCVLFVLALSQPPL